ncbi:MAG: type IV pilin protein [Magnetococcales bacterium]|nr:type IV pilin protein [Magnetococcales bacterium]
MSTMVSNNNRNAPKDQIRWGNTERGSSMVWYLLIVVVILAGTAYWEYTDVMLLFNRHDGVDTVMEVVARQDKYYEANQKYATTLEELGYTTVHDFSIASPRGHYRILLADADGASYSLSAEPQGAQVEDARCAPLTYTSKGRAKSSKGSSASACW